MKPEALSRAAASDARTPFQNCQAEYDTGLSPAVPHGLSGLPLDLVAG